MTMKPTKAKIMKVIIDKELEEIFPDYLENRRKEIKDLKKFVEHQDFASLKVVAHRLAGNAGSYGLDELSRIGAQMEADSLKGDLRSIAKYVQDIETYLANLTFEYR